MKTKDVGILIFRIMAIYAFLQTPRFTADIFNFSTTIFSFSALTSFMNISFILISSGPFLLYLLLAVYFWMKADVLAVYLLSKIEEKDFSLPISFLELQSIAFSTIGVYLVAQSLPKISQALFINAIMITLSGQNPGDLNYLILAFLEFVIGVISDN
ncbi:MAG: hypothetical protein AB1656_14530 [Candidatus Omnitrophota bacterium]